MNARALRLLAAASALAACATPSRTPEPGDSADGASSGAESPAGPAAQPGAPARLNPPDAYVQLFKWRWNDIARECTDFLGPKGFGGVQISPPQEAIVKDTWWGVYQPVNHASFTSDMGDEASLRAMIAACHAAGVRVYADAVINHMAVDASSSEWGDGAANGTGGTEYVPMRLKYAQFGRQDFHEPCEINYDSAKSTQTCWLVGLPDLDTGSEHVRRRLAEYLARLVEMGVDGFRIDAAKHMAPEDLAAIYALAPRTTKLGEPVFITQEVIEDQYWIDLAAYTRLGSVNEFRFTRAIRDAFRGTNRQDLKILVEEMAKDEGKTGYGLLPSRSATVFVNNHDTERNKRDSLNLRTDGDGTYELANIYLLTQPYGRAQLQSGFLFRFNATDTNAPKESPHDAQGRPLMMKAWDFVHRWPALYPAVKFRSATAGQPMTVVHASRNRLAYRRGSVGFVALNVAAEPWPVLGMKTGLPAGTYCNVAHGLVDGEGKACLGTAGNASPSVTVDGSGTVVSTDPSGYVLSPLGAPLLGALVIYMGQKVKM